MYFSPVSCSLASLLQRLARNADAEGTRMDDVQFVNGARGMHTSYSGSDVRTSVGVKQASSDFLKRENEHHASSSSSPPASYSQEGPSLSPYRSRIRRAAALRADHNLKATSNNTYGNSGSSSSGGPALHYEKGASHASHYRAVAQPWAPSRVGSSYDAAVPPESNIRSRDGAGPPQPPPPLFSSHHLQPLPPQRLANGPVATTATSADELFERRLQAARAAAAGGAARGSGGGTTTAVQGPLPSRSEETTGMAKLSSAHASSSSADYSTHAAGHSSGAREGVNEGSDQFGSARRQHPQPQLAFVPPSPDPTAVRSSLAELLVQGHTSAAATRAAAAAATGAQSAPQTSVLVGGSTDVQRTDYNSSTTSSSVGAVASPMQSQQGRPSGSTLSPSGGPGAGLFRGDISSSSISSPPESGGFSLAELAAADSF